MAPIRRTSTPVSRVSVRLGPEAALSKQHYLHMTEAYRRSHTWLHTQTGLGLMPGPHRPCSIHHNSSALHGSVCVSLAADTRCVFLHQIRHCRFYVSGQKLCFMCRNFRRTWLMCYISCPFMQCIPEVFRTLHFFHNYFVMLQPYAKIV